MIKERITKKIIDWSYDIQNFFLHILKNLFFDGDYINVKKILVFRTGSLGDNVCALPAFYSIRKNFPEARIDVLTNTGAENLVSLANIIDKTLVNEIIDYRNIDKKKLFKLLKKEKYNLMIQLPQYDASFFRYVRDIVITKSLGIKKAFGWQVGSTRFLAKWQATLRSFDNERDRLLKILESNGLKNFGLHYPFGITERHKSNVKELLTLNGFTDKNRNVALIVGGKKSQNRWPLQHFVVVKDYLIDAGFNILLIGNEEDNEFAENLKHENIVNFCGKVEPMESAELLRNCCLAISNDTGPMHLSYAVGTPVIAIFSSRDYKEKWFPPMGNNFVLRYEEIYCSDCYFNVCHGEKCLVKITPPKVIDLINTSGILLRNIHT